MKTLKPTYIQYDAAGNKTDSAWKPEILKCVTEVLNEDVRHGLHAHNYPLDSTPLAILEMDEEEIREKLTDNMYLRSELGDWLETHRIIGHRVHFSSLSGPVLAFLFVVVGEDGVDNVLAVSPRDFGMAHPNLSPKGYAKPLKKLAKAFRKLYGDCTDFTVRLSEQQPTEVGPWLQRNGQFWYVRNWIDPELTRNPSLVSLDVVAWGADAVGELTGDTALAGRILLVYQGGTIVYKGITMAPQPFSL